jgi:hypothetical protein
MKFGTNTHKAHILMQVFGALFPDRLVSLLADKTWCANSPDLAVPNDFLWGYVTSRVYETRPTSPDHLTFYTVAATLRTTRFNVKKFYVVPKLRLCVLYGSQNKQQLLPYKTLTDWFL